VTPEEMSYIIGHAQIEVLFLENKNQLKVWDKISASCPTVKKVILIDKFDLIDSPIVTWDSILDKNISPDEIKVVRTSANTVRLEDEATIVYTSGTTGNPKGVVLTHRQIISEVSEAFTSCGVRTDDCTLTFLPFSHVFGRIENWAHAHFGYEMAFAENLEKIKSNLLEINPTFIFAVPRIFEKVYVAVISSIENNKIRQILFDWALAQSKNKLAKQRSHELVPLKDWAMAEIAQKLVLNKVKHAFGNRLRFCVSGGAPLNPVIGEFFASCGVQVLEGYGLTETTAAIFVNTPFDYQIGTVGKPIGDVKIKFADDGEILIKSDKVMAKYYNDDKATAAVFEDGWFKTGDIGELTEEGRLRITDRKKDLIKTANGKYVAPQKIEGLLKLNPLVANALIHGDQKKYIVALLSLDRAQVKKWAEANGVDDTDISKVINNTKFADEIRRHIIKVNSELANHESVKKYHIVEDEFTIENGSLTHSMKVKRKYLDAKYKSLISNLY
jgi:long-chain acyl-CoA synthetase